MQFSTIFASVFLVCSINAAFATPLGSSCRCSCAYSSKRNGMKELPLEPVDIPLAVCDDQQCQVKCRDVYPNCEITSGTIKAVCNRNEQPLGDDTTETSVATTQATASPSTAAPMTTEAPMTSGSASTAAPMTSDSSSTAAPMTSGSASTPAPVTGSTEAPMTTPSQSPMTEQTTNPASGSTSSPASGGSTSHSGSSSPTTPNDGHGIKSAFQLGHLVLFGAVLSWLFI